MEKLIIQEICKMYGKNYNLIELFCKIVKNELKEEENIQDIIQEFYKIVK